MSAEKSYWLVKSEPDAWSWDQMVASGAEGTGWTGVRNHLAKQQMMAMKRGDLAFFYHSNVGKEIVGIVEIIKTFHPDPTNSSGKFGMVDVRAVKPPEAAGHARGDQGRPALFRPRAGQDVPPFGPAGIGGSLAGDLRARRPIGRLSPAPRGTARPRRSRRKPAAQRLLALGAHAFDQPRACGLGSLAAHAEDFFAFGGQDERTRPRRGRNSGPLLARQTGAAEIGDDQRDRLRRQLRLAGQIRRQQAGSGADQRQRRELRRGDTEIGQQALLRETLGARRLAQQGGDVAILAGKVERARAALGGSSGLGSSSGRILTMALFRACENGA